MPADTNTTEAVTIPEKSNVGLLEVGDRYIQAGTQAVQMGLTDEQLMSAFIRFDCEDLLPYIYHYSPDIGIYEWLSIFRNPAVHTLGAFRENPETRRWNLEGMLWVTGIRDIGGGYLVADVGHGFFRGVFGASRYAELGIEWLIQKLGISVITGTTPEHNRAARIFAQRAGFTVVGPLPGLALWEGQPCGVYLSALTKEQWATKRPWKEA